ncbi:DMT family transporter [Cytophagaceae bacterium ABcell3]|nr:DMT family transporter [Cytophagaceae bacterium ABcell3]
MNDLFKAHALLIASTLIAGFNLTLSKFVMPEYIQPSAIIVIRVLTSAIFFGLLHHIFIKEPIAFKDIKKIFPCALFGIAINQLLFFEGLNLTAPINAALMMTTAPVLVLLISSYMLKERITLPKALGILLAATGAILLLLQSGTATGELFKGDLFVLINAASWAVFLVIAKPLLQQYHAITIIKWMFYLGFFMVLPFGVKDVGAINWGVIPTHALLSLGFIVLFATIGAYYLNVGVLRYVNPSVAGTYIYFQPVVASLIAVSFNQDTFTNEKILYSSLIVTGVYMVSHKRSQKAVKAK